MFDKLKKKIKDDDLIESVEETEIDLSEEEVAELKAKAETMDSETIESHRNHYSEPKLWNKVKKYAKKAGSTAVYAILLLYFVLQKDEVPKKSKAIILGALGYFILPLDLIPDFAVGVGFTDDIGALIAALWQVAMYIDDEVKAQAKSKLRDWFGDGVDTSEIDDKLA